jgi:hypothetical protein
VNKQYSVKSDKPYKSAFVDFIRSKQWHWFITIPIGYCENEDQVLKRLRTIEAILCGKYLPNRYHRLPDGARCSMVVAFEGDMKLGTRHAHILAYIPTPTKKRIPQSMLSSLFPGEFRFLWNKFELSSAQTESEYRWARARDPWADIEITPANTARSVYTVKDVRLADVSWSRFEFVTPPKFKKFDNENLSAIRNRARQKSCRPAHGASVVR